MVNLHASLRHHFFEIAIAEAISEGSALQIVVRNGFSGSV